MSNHYHLVFETPNANLVAGMAWLQSTYTIRLNRRRPPSLIPARICCLVTKALPEFRLLVTTQG